MYFGPADGDSAASMFEDLAGLFEQAAADGTPIREIVGDDPVKFAKAFVQNYSEGSYVPTRVRKRLTRAIGRAEEERSR
jgi:DNA-binding ferritin-like protein (Dps family)